VNPQLHNPNLNFFGTSAEVAATDCYKFDLPKDYTVNVNATDCRVDASSSSSGASITAKPIKNVAIASSTELSQAAQFDLANIVNEGPGAKLISKEPTTWAGDAAYAGTIQDNAGYTYQITYVLHPAGYQISNDEVKLFAIIQTTHTANAPSKIPIDWSWQ
jgi:hypothetical protein